MRNKKGSIALSVIIFFMTVLPALLFVTTAGISYAESLKKALSATEFAAESIKASVVSYDSSTNIAVFDDSTQISKQVLDIVKGNLGIKVDSDLSNTFVSEMPVVTVVIYNEIQIGGMDVTYEGKAFHFDKPGVLIAVSYKYKALFTKSIAPPEILVVRKYEIMEA